MRFSKRKFPSQQAMEYDQPDNLARHVSKIAFQTREVHLRWPLAVEETPTISPLLDLIKL